MVAKRPHCKEVQYRIIVVSKAGEGEPSNTIVGVF
jgi:hypothetical protein